MKVPAPTSALKLASALLVVIAAIAIYSTARVFSGTVESSVANLAIAGTEWLRRLVRSRESAGLTIVGPAPSAVERIKTRWRWHVLMKSEHPHELTRVGRYFMERFPVAARDGLRVTFDRDPVTLL